MHFYSYIIIFLCGEYLYLMIPVIGICRVFIFTFFHIKRVTTIRTRRNYIFSLYTWSCPNSGAVELSFFMYVFLSFAVSFKPINY